MNDKTLAKKSWVNRILTGCHPGDHLRKVSGEPGSHLSNQVSRLGFTNSETTRANVPPNAMQYEVTNTTKEVFCLKTFNLHLIKPLNLISRLREIQARGTS